MVHGMTHLLGVSASQRLRELSGRKCVLVFDFDGTLAPIVADRELAKMRSRTSALLNRLCALYPCAIVSGRSLTDTRARLDGVDIRVVYGSHGLEPGPHLAEYERLMAQLCQDILPRLAGCDWFDIEDKRYSLAVHYRRATHRTDAHRRIRDVLAELSLPIRVVEGKCVINIVPRAAPHKGDALVAIHAQFGANDALYVGDDVTDEDAFLGAAERSWVAVRVGKTERSRATYYLRRQREIDSLLTRLIRLRSEKRRVPLRVD